MMKCSEKAFAMCPTRHLCGTVDDAIFTEGSECAAFNNAVEDKPMTNADRMNELRKCPFCGGEELTISSILGEHYIVCDTCTCAGPGAWTEQEAIEAWNRRDDDGEI